MSDAEPRPVAVLDTNVIVSGVLSPRGIPNRILRGWQQNAFNLISSADLADELADVLGRPDIQRRFRLDRVTVDQLVSALAAAAVRPLSLDALPVRCRDPKDDPVLACALGGNAGFIVSGDQDLLVLNGHKDLHGLRIVTPRDFLVVLEGLSPSQA